MSNRHPQLKVSLLGDTETVEALAQLIADHLGKELHIPAGKPYTTRKGQVGICINFHTSLEIE